MRKFTIIIVLTLLLTACQPGQVFGPSLTSTSTVTDTPTPTNTPPPTLTPTSTSTPIPIEGKLFFDMNGSGLQDEAIFNYDSKRLTDERQPLQPDLLKVITEYVRKYSDLRDGDPIIINEPGLSGFTVCVIDNCTKTDAVGAFTIFGVNVDSSLSIADPNAGNPALEMRYFNIWKKAVTVKEYSKQIDTSTMAALEIIPDCDADVAALVCKQDKDTLLVREQHLIDTQIIPISKKINIDTKVEVGLMQGFLTSPLKPEKHIWLWSYVDHNYEFGEIADFSGSNSLPDYYRKITGTGDQHQGIDWETKIGDYLLSVSQGKAISVYEGDEGNAALQIRLLFQPGGTNGFTSDYGHNAVNLINNGSPVFRGQIIGLSGKSGSEIPHLHYGMFSVPNSVSSNSWIVEEIFLNEDYPKVEYQDGGLVPAVYDPFRYLLLQSSSSLWSIDNLIVYYP